MGFDLFGSIKSIGSKVADVALGAALAPVKYVGGPVAHFLGSKATFEDFDRGVHAIATGQVKKDDVSRAFHATEQFVAHAPANAIRNTGKLAADVTKAAAEAGGGLLKAGLGGLFKGGGIVLVLVILVALYVGYLFLSSQKGIKVGVA